MGQKGSLSAGSACEAQSRQGLPVWKGRVHVGPGIKSANARGRGNQTAGAGIGFARVRRRDTRFLTVETRRTD